MGKWIERIIAFISALFILWGIVSFIEVNCKNLTENPTYWEYNMFIVLSEMRGE